MRREIPSECTEISSCRLIAKPGSAVAGTPDNIWSAAAGCAASPSASSVDLGSPVADDCARTGSEVVTWHRESGENVRIVPLADPRSEYSFDFADGMAKAQGKQDPHGARRVLTLIDESGKLIFVTRDMNPF